MNFNFNYLFALFIMFSFAGCTKNDQKKMNNSSALINQQSAMQMKQRELEGEKASFVIKDDTVQVNNRYCAFSRTKMSEKDLGKWTNTVEYTGPNKKFNGKKLVFNQCCGGCVSKFPTMWQADAEEVLRYHGLQ